MSLHIDEEALYEELLYLLHPLCDVEQDPRYHPEGDALTHSLQVYQHARRGCQDPELWAAALLHDIGKIEGAQGHAKLGALWLEDLMPPRVVWLVEHHMDLLHAPRKTRKRMARDPRLLELESLRRWDLAGREPGALVLDVEVAVLELLHELQAAWNHAPQRP